LFFTDRNWCRFINTVYGQLMAINLDIRHLRMLVALDQHGGVTAAAKALGVTQPALSHQIQEAERRAGVPLFRRVRRRLVFTWQGQELLQSARLVVAELDRAERDLARYGEEVHALVRLVTRAYCPFHWLPDFLDVLQKTHPDIELEHHAETLTAPYAALEAGLADLVLTPGFVRRPDLRSMPCFEDDLVGLVAAEGPLAARDFLEAADYAGDCFITYSTVLEGGLEHEQFFRHGKGMPQRYQRTSSPEAMAALVAGGIGMSIASGWVARDLCARHPVVALPLTSVGLRCVWSVVTRSSDLADHPAVLAGSCLADWLSDHVGNVHKKLS
jgi:LysR family transcriptional regulator for metE and metH